MVKIDNMFKKEYSRRDILKGIGGIIATATAPSLIASTRIINREPINNNLQNPALCGSITRGLGYRNLAGRMAAFSNTNQEEEMYKELFLSVVQKTNFPVSNFYDENITKIGDCAFSGITGLVSISLPNCTRYGNSPFTYCSDLVSVNLPNLNYFTDNASIGPFQGTLVRVVRFPAASYLPYNMTLYSNIEEMYFENATSMYDLSIRSITVKKVVTGKITSMYNRTFGYLNGLDHDINIYTQNTSTEILAFNLSTHMGNTTSQYWPFIKIHCTNGVYVSYDGTQWTTFAES